MERTHEGKVWRVTANQRAVNVPTDWPDGSRVSITRLTRTLEEAVYDALQDHRIAELVTFQERDAERLVALLRSHGVQLLGPDDPEPRPPSTSTELDREVMHALLDAGFATSISNRDVTRLLTRLRRGGISLVSTAAPAAAERDRPTRRKSRDARPGMYAVDYAGDRIKVVRERKDDDSGWWFQGGGGLADVIADSIGQSYYFLTEHELVQHLRPELERRHGRA